MHQLVHYKSEKKLLQISQWIMGRARNSQQSIFIGAMRLFNTTEIASKSRLVMIEPKKWVGRIHNLDSKRVFPPKLYL